MKKKIHLLSPKDHLPDFAVCPFDCVFIDFLTAGEDFLTGT